jgi:DNA-directed RNA polymerase subunit beta'
MRAIVEGGDVVEALRDRVLGRTTAEEVIHPERDMLVAEAGDAARRDLLDASRRNGRGRSQGAFTA